MATRTISPAGGNWNATTAWVEGVVPTAADDVVATSSSGALTINVSASFLTMDLTGYTNTMTVGLVNVFCAGTKFLLPTTMTLVLTSATSSALLFSKLSAGTITITTGGKSVQATSTGYNGPSSSATYQFQDAFTSAGPFTHICGTLDTNSQAVSWGSFNSNSSTAGRVFSFGSSAISITGSGGFIVSVGGGPTFTANTATITLTGTSAGLSSANGGNMNLNGASVVFSGPGSQQVGGFTGASGLTCANLTRTGTATKTDGLILSGFLTITDTLTLTGNSLTNRLLVQSNTAGTTRTITAANVVLTNADFMDITGAGAATWTGTSLGDALGNSGITFTAATTRYGVAAGNWSSTAVWSATSGGAAGASVPLPQDTAILDGNSPSQNYIADMPRLCKDLNCTGFAFTLNHSSLVNYVYGSVTLSAAMTFTGTQVWEFYGRSACTLTSAGKVFGAIYMAMPGGSLSLQDAFSAVSLQIVSGTFTAGSANVTLSGVQGLNTSGAFVPKPTINMGSGTWTLSGSGGIWTPTTAATGVTLNAQTSTIVISDQSAAVKTFAGAGTTYNNLTVTANNLVITGAPTFNVVTLTPATQITWPAASTTTVASLVGAAGQSNGFVRLPATGAGNSITSPSSAALQITGDITIDVRAAFPLWAPNQNTFLVSKWGGTAATDSYELFLSTAGKLTLNLYNGTTTVTSTASVTTGLAANAVKWVRVSVASGTATFYLSDDGVTWAQLGTSQVAASAIASNAQQLEIGVNAAGGQFNAGNYYEVRIYNSALGSGSGTPVFDADFTAKPFGANSFVESSSNAATVTINGPVAQIGDGRIQFVSSTPGTQATISQATGIVAGDYLVLQDIKAVGGATFNAGSHSVNVSNNTGWSFVTSYAHTLSPTQSQGVAVVAAVQRTVSVTGAQAAAVQAAVARAVAATQAASPTARRTVSRTSTTSQVQTQGLRRVVSATLWASQAQTPALRRSPSRVAAVSGSQHPALISALARTTKTTQAQAASERRTLPPRLRAVTQSSTSAIGRAVIRTLRATQAQVVTLLGTAASPTVGRVAAMATVHVEVDDRPTLVGRVRDEPSLAARSGSV